MPGGQSPVSGNGESSLKILAVADHEAKYFYDYYTPGRLSEFDLILSCGDLRREYLEFLVTMARCPVLYVFGNHDDRLDQRPPEGCICIEDKIYVHQGVRILGLGGSYRYHPKGVHMYTERQMAARVRRLRLALWRNKGFDILLTHAAGPVSPQLFCPRAYPSQLWAGNPPENRPGGHHGNQRL